MTAVAQQIMNRIRRHGRGWAFTPKDFLDLAPRNNVAVALHALAKSGHVRHFARGLYDYPRQHPTKGDFPPQQDQAAAAVARATGDRIYPTGAMAANKLGLTTQVPAGTAYVTTGKPKTIRAGNLKIDLRKTAIPKTLTHDKAFMALLALDNMGPRQTDQDMIGKVAKNLDTGDKKDIHANLRYIRNPWLADVARQLSV